MFDDPPYDLDKELQVTYYAGLALIQSGNIDRGSHLIQSYLDLQEPFDEVYGESHRSVAGRLLLGDTEAALDKLAGLAQYQYDWPFNQTFLERSSVFDPIRNEPEFIELLDEYRKNAAEQRRLLKAAKEAT